MGITLFISEYILINLFKLLFVFFLCCVGTLCVNFHQTKKAKLSLVKSLYLLIRVFTHRLVKGRLPATIVNDTTR